MRTPAPDKPATRSRLLVAIAVVLAVGTVAAAEDAAVASAAGASFAPSGAVVRVSIPATDELRPNSVEGLDTRASRSLAVAFRLAAERLGDSPRCAAMFSRLGADGLARLRENRYLPAAGTGVERVCSRGVGAAAFTTVGNSRTVICPGFGRLDPKQAAVIVLHEALHSAGLPESPQTPGAMTSAEINDWVADRCGL